MGELYRWVSDILFFLIFISAAAAMLPSERYGRYFRFFGGIVMILLAAGPLVRGMDLDSRIARLYEGAAFENQTRELSQEILGMEHQRLALVFDEYESSVEEGIYKMAARQQVGLSRVDVSIERNQESPAYGQVAGIVLVAPEGEPVVAAGAAAAEVVEEPGRKESGAEAAVEHVRVGRIPPVEVSSEHLDAETGADVEAEVCPSPEMEQLQGKVEEYYGLEPGKVEIQYEIR